MSDTDFDFEARLTRELHQLVDSEAPSPELRERIAQDLGSPARAGSSRRRWLPAAAAALLVIAGIGALASTGGDDGGVDVATDPTPAVADDTEDDDDAVIDDDDADDERADSTTTVVDTATTIAPPPGEGDDGSLPADEAPAPAPNDGPAPTPGNGPATTVPQCENSTDPACGAFRWSPQPTNQPATLRIAAPGTIVAGEPVQLSLTMSDPDGPVTFGCYSVNLDRPGLSTGACAVERFECPARYGPWAPPAPKAGQATTQASVQFDETGTYVISVNVDPADGCDNVDPYRSGATATLTVEVVAA